MSKQLNTNQQEIYDKLVKYLDIIVLANQTIELLKTDEVFQTIFVDCTSIINKFEEEYQLDPTHSSRYAQAYFTIVNKNLKVDTNIDIDKNLVDITDKVNYLNTYLINKFGMDFKDLENSFKNSSTKSSEDNVVEATVVGGAVHTPISDEQILEKSGYTIKDVAEDILSNQANMVFQSKFVSGDIYIYKTKPKLIYILKFVSLALFIIMAVLSLAAFCVLVQHNGILSFVNNNDTNKTPYKATLILPFPYISLLFWFMVGMTIYSLVTRRKNENFKYYMYIFMPFVIILITLFSDLFTSTGQNFIIFWDRTLNALAQVSDNLNSDGGAWRPEVVKAIDAINIYRILQFIVYGCEALFVVIIITTYIFNPKQDIERINLIKQEIMKQLRNGEIDMSKLKPFTLSQLRRPFI